MNYHQKLVKCLMDKTTKEIAKPHYENKKKRKNRIKKYEMDCGIISYRETFMIIKEVLRCTKKYINEDK